MKFIWNNICCRFGVPRTIVNDNGAQFNSAKIRSWCEEMKVEQRFIAVAHPQANGQVEVTNRILVNAVKKCLDTAGEIWVDELQSVLRAYRTSKKESTGDTPCALVYRADAVMPVEVKLSTDRIINYNKEINKEDLCFELDAIYERREDSRAKMEN